MRSAVEVDTENREFKKLRRQLQGKRHIKIELCDYSMLITSFKIGGVHFRLLGTNGFHVKAKNERCTSASSRCRQNLKYENFTSSFGRLRQNIAPKSVPHVQHDYFSSLAFNQWNRCRWRCGRQILKSLKLYCFCPRCRWILKFGSFTLSFGRQRQRIVLKCVAHVQHDYFSSFNQSDDFFPASSLPLHSWFWVIREF